MDNQMKDESISPDVARPRFLLRRYDSVSGGSDSSSGSSSSRSSCLQSPVRQHYENGRRTRMNTYNSGCEESTSRSEQMNGRERSNGITDTEIQFSDNLCIFCDTLVNERQYYLWNSQYTKSSLCSRCSYDNDRMRYISYWGTPSYQSGSWRKRYNAGRGIDIDLSPLLEVLERIDQIDTSIDGRKAKRIENCYNSPDNIPLSDNTESKESYEITKRRRRRQANRSVIGDLNDLNNNIKTSDHLNNSSPHRVSTENKDFDDSIGIHLNTNAEHKAKEYSVAEICTNTENIDEIEPLQVINVTEQLPAQTILHTEYIDSQNFESCQERKESISPSFNKDTISAESLLAYRQGRRKSNYEEFLAGLEPMSQLDRRSSAAQNIKCYNKGKRNINNITESKINCERRYQNTTKSTNENNFKCDQGEEKENEVASNGRYNICKREKADIKFEKTPDHTTTKKVKHIRPKYKYKLKRRNTPFMEENDFFSKPESLCESKKLPSECEAISSYQKSEGNILLPTNTTTDNSSSDEATFANIKKKFEKLSNRTSTKRYHERFQSDFVQQRHFRSKYIESIGDASISSNCKNNNDECDKVCLNDENDNERNPKYVNNVQYTKRNDLYQNSESDHETSESDGTDDSSDCENHCKLIQHTEKENDLTCNRNNMKEINKIKFTENSKKQHECFRRDVTDVKQPNVTKPSKQSAGDEKESHDENETKMLENLPPEDNSSDSIGKHLGDQKTSKNVLKCCKDFDDDMLLSSKSSLLENGSLSKTAMNTEQSYRSTAARAREMKYRASENDIEHENPNIERIKRKLSKKPKYENKDDSHSDEMNDMITELNGSDDEEIELGWRSRGYNTDFYMSRRSITGGEIIDRYKRALSNRRSKNNSREASRRSSKSRNMANMIDEVMTHSAPVSRNGLKSTKLTSSAQLTRTNTQLFNGKENENDQDNGLDYKNEDCNISTGVSATALQAALRRANNCSKRMTERLRTQLSQQSDSYDSSS